MEHVTASVGKLEELLAVNSKEISLTRAPSSVAIGEDILAFYENAFYRCVALWTVSDFRDTHIHTHTDTHGHIHAEIIPVLKQSFWAS